MTLATMTQASRGPLGRITGLLQLPCDRRGMASQDDNARDHQQQRSHLARDLRRAAGEFLSRQKCARPIETIGSHAVIRARTGETRMPFW